MEFVIANLHNPDLFWCINRWDTIEFAERFIKESQGYVELPRFGYWLPEKLINKKEKSF